MIDRPWCEVTRNAITTSPARRTWIYLHRPAGRSYDAGMSERVHQDDQLWAADELTNASEDALIAFLVEALGCANEPVQGDPKPPPAPIDRSPRASSYEEEVTTRWRQETVGCTLELERIESWFPGDVNEPERSHTHFLFRGARRDGATSVYLRANVGTRTVSLAIDAAIEDWARILDAFKRRFGEFG